MTVGCLWTNALIGSKVPDFSLPALETVDAPGFSTADLTGKVSVVNVFASWCVPCRAEHPLLMQLASRDDLNLFGINYNDVPENAAAFLTSLGNPYDRIGADRDRRVSLDFGVYGVPETFVIDADGVITFKVTGPMSPAIFETELLPAIDQGGHSLDHSGAVMTTTAVAPVSVADYESVYADALGDPGRIPWPSRRASPAVVNWLNAAAPTLVRCGARVAVAGCGLGHDAREVIRRGYEVTAFDISAAAIPEPGTLVLIASGVAALGFRHRKRRTAAL